MLRVFAIEQQIASTSNNVSVIASAHVSVSVLERDSLRIRLHIRQCENTSGCVCVGETEVV